MEIIEFMTKPNGIQSHCWLDSRMNSEVHNDTAPDSGGRVLTMAYGWQT